jgi:hypothetical protein
VLQAKSMVHVGILDVCHGWVLWDPEGNKLLRGASHVVFDESVLPRDAPDSNVLDPALSSIRLAQLGNSATYGTWKFRTLALTQCLPSCPSCPTLQTPIFTRR